MRVGGGAALWERRYGGTAVTHGRNFSLVPPPLLSVGVSDFFPEQDKASQQSTWVWCSQEGCTGVNNTS